MNLADIVTKAEVFEQAVKHPSLKVTSRTKVMPTLETAQKVVINSLEYAVAKKIQDEMQPRLEEVLETHEMMHGKRDDCDTDEAVEEWDNAIDNAFEESLALYIQYLSADWLGNNTIACGLHEKDAPSKLGGSIGREVYKQMTYGKTPNQILSNAGIVGDDIQNMLDEHIAASTNQTPEEKAAMAEQQSNDVNDVIAKIAAHVGKEYDIMAVYGDLDMASDDDEILAAGAAARLGIVEADTFVLQMYRLEHGGDTPDKLDELLKAAVAGKKPAKGGKGNKAKSDTPKASNKPVKASDALPEAGTIDPAIFIALKQSGGAGDKEMGEGLGLSRATYNNFVNGKTPFVPSPDQYQFLRGEIVSRAQALCDALAKLDGTAPIAVV